MSKQTINIGASPNDGTGTPLRTSFDYTNQNFTELYTALGGGVGLPGATTQVIFNDGGTNLAGDAGLVYNKTTDALTVAGLVTAGSATITGDLTVRTNKLAVTSTGVGIGTATPNAAYILDLTTSNDGRARQWIADTALLATGNLANGYQLRTLGASIDGIKITNYAVSVEYLRLNSSGNVVLSGGTTTANGVGITFPATQVASSDANCLDDYEEGTWTPTVGGTATYTTQTGRYTKIGNRVYVNMRLEILLIGTGSSFLISGLPFTSGVTSNLSSASVGYFGNLAISANYIAGYIASGGSTVRMTGTTAASANITNGIAVIGNATDLALSFFYEV